MPITSWNPLGEMIFFGNEMDPIFEDLLALYLDEWLNSKDGLFIPITGDSIEDEGLELSTEDETSVKNDEHLS